MKKRISLFLFVTFLSFAMSGCATLTVQAPTPTPDVVATETAIVANAFATLTAQAPTPTPTPVPPTPTPLSAMQEVEARFSTSWVYFPPGDDFTNGEVNGGTEAWHADMHNVSETPVTGVELSLASEIEFDQFIPDPVTVGPPTYQWSFGDVLEGSGAGTLVGLRWSPDVVFPVRFTPGFDAARFADITQFSGPGTQTLTIEVTPRDDRVAGTHRLGVQVQAEANELVNAVITSPTTDESQGIRLSPDGQWLVINVPALELGTIWTTTVTIQVTPMVPKVEYIPYVHIGWGETLASGTTSGSSLSYRAGDTVNEVGSWTLRAEGGYEWHWNEDVLRFVKWYAYSQEQ